MCQSCPELAQYFVVLPVFESAPRRRRIAARPEEKLCAPSAHKAGKRLIEWHAPLSEESVVKQFVNYGVRQGDRVGLYRRAYQWVIEPSQGAECGGRTHSHVEALSAKTLRFAFRLIEVEEALVWKAAHDRKTPHFSLEPVAVRCREHQYQRVPIELREGGEALARVEAEGVDGELSGRNHEFQLGPGGVVDRQRCATAVDQFLDWLTSGKDSRLLIRRSR